MSAPGLQARVGADKGPLALLCAPSRWEKARITAPLSITDTPAPNTTYCSTVAPAAILVSQARCAVCGAIMVTPAAISSVRAPRDLPGNLGDGQFGLGIDSRDDGFFGERHPRPWRPRRSAKPDDVGQVVLALRVSRCLRARSSSEETAGVAVTITPELHCGDRELVGRWPPWPRQWPSRAPSSTTRRP